MNKVHFITRDKSFYKEFFSLLVFIALQNLIVYCVNLADNVMLGRWSEEALSGVALANQIQFLLQMIVSSVGEGVVVLASQYWGKKDLPSISRVIGVAALLGVSLALVVALVLFAWPVAIMDLLSNKHHLSLLGAPYLRLIGFSYVFNMLSSIYVSAQRSVENAGFGMKLFGMSTVLNTGLNYLLIFGKCGFPALGVEGAALATLLSRVAEFLVCLICALRSRLIPLDLRALLRPGWEMLRRFVKYASPVLVNELFWGLGNSLLTVILGHTTVSVAFLAANGVMGNLNRLFLVVCFGLGAATAVMVGKAIGEGQRHDELMALAKTLSWVTILVGAVLAVIALVLVPLLFQPVIFPLFELYGLSAHLATTLAVTGFACIPLHAYSISAVTGILRAGGDVLWSTALDLAPQWVLALPLTALLALVLDADPWFVSLAIQAESFLKCPICLWRIRSRKWIHDVTLPEGRENG